MRHFSKLQQEETRLREYGIRVNYVRPVSYKGRRVWALGKRLYHNQPQHQTFHEFILAILQQALGREWWDRELNANPKHFLMECFQAFNLLKKKHATDANKETEHRWSVVPDGPSRFLLSVAFDVCSLFHTDKLPESLMSRLRHRDQFQGARYELGVAAVFARMNYDISFLDNPRNTEKHCEFIATDRATGKTVAVGAKSKHRKGVLHQSGVPTNALDANIARHIRKATTQSPGDMPFLIFVDINTPPAEIAVINETWRPQILKMLEDQHRPSVENPTMFTALYVTNFPYHYSADKCDGKNEVLEIRSPLPKHVIGDDTVYDSLIKALSHYGDVPCFDVDGVLGW